MNMKNMPITVVHSNGIVTSCICLVFNFFLVNTHIYIYIFLNPTDSNSRHAKIPVPISTWCIQHISSALG